MLKAGVRGYAASAFVCLHGGRAGRKAGLRFLVEGGRNRRPAFLPALPPAKATERLLGVPRADGLHA